MNTLGQIFSLRANEAQALETVGKYCSANGFPPNMATAVEMAGVETLMVPGIGGLPGWLVGFAARWARQSVRCTLAQGDVVVAGLRKLQREAGQSPESDHEAVYALRTALARASFAEAA